jgi:hypothetical protein
LEAPAGIGIITDESQILGQHSESDLEDATVFEHQGKAVEFELLKVDLEIYNGGSDLSIGRPTIAGPLDPDPDYLVPDSLEESLGAYLLVNNDIDTLDFFEAPTAEDIKPDFEVNGRVEYEDNLAALKLDLDALSSLTQGVIELEVPDEGQKVKFWNYNRRGDAEDQIVFTSGKKQWDLSIPEEKSDLFTRLAGLGIWMEAIEPSAEERDIEIKVNFIINGQTVLMDQVNATAVLVHVGAGTYRDNGWTVGGINERGHAALLYKMSSGILTRDRLADDSSFGILQMSNATGGPTTTYLTNHTENADGLVFHNIAEPSNLSYLERLKILQVARDLSGAGHIWYVAVDLVEYDGFTWDGGSSFEGRIDDVDRIRCDGVVELAYELSGINAWGRIEDDGSIGYLLHVGDNLSAHNDFEIFGDWRRSLQPLTQGGVETTFKGVDWDSTLVPIESHLTPSIVEDD